ncbi:MAG: hypothetical protein EON93_03480 [Burkholderiales bacterium]|nr:MAG: hypothetical protein EON93_03480 [Burkholderiales bacterium]
MVNLKSIVTAAPVRCGGRSVASRAGLVGAIALVGLLQSSCAGHAVRVAPVEAASTAVQGPITTRELVELKLISVLAVSPDQKSAVVRIDPQDVASGTSRLTWQVIDLESRSVKASFDAGDPTWNANHYIAGETPHWSPDSAWIYFRKLVGQDFQVWRARSDGTEISQVTHDQADVVGLDVRADGSIVYATVGATRKEIIAAEAVEHAQGVLMGPNLISGFPISKSFPVNGRMASYRHIGKRALNSRGTLLGDRPLRVMAQVEQNGDFAELKGPEVQTFLDKYQLVPGYTGISDSAYVKPPVLIDGDLTASIDYVPRKASSDGVSVHPLGRVSWRRRGQTSATSCSDPICVEADSVQIVGWRAGRGELVLQTEERGLSRLVTWDTSTGTVRKLWERQGVLGTVDSGELGACQLAFDRAICIHAAGDLAPRIVAISLDTGSSQVLLDPNPGLTPGRLGVTSIIKLSDGMGGTSIGIVILPHNRPAAPLPLVITSYSCRGFLQGGSGRDVPEHVLVGLGYAVVCTDHSSLGMKYGAEYKGTTDDGNRSSLGLFEDAVNVLAKSGIADRDRVMLSGFSGSSTAAAYVVTASSAFTAAIVTTRGSSDALGCYLSSHYRSCERGAEREGSGWPYDRRDGYLKNSPAWNADKVTAPFLMQLPEAEYHAMMQLYGALLHYDRAVEMYVFPESYHYKHDPRQRQAVYDRNIDWIDFWLKGVDPTRVDAKTTAIRWRGMRDRQCAATNGDPAHDHAMWYCQPLARFR